MNKYMKTKNLITLFALFFSLNTFGQTMQEAESALNMTSAHKQTVQGKDPLATEEWQVSINSMNPEKRMKITSMVHNLQQRGASRSAMADILKAAGFGVIPSLVDIAATEVINLAKMRKRQKSQWMGMIEKECSYTDSITSVKGLKDFYRETSRYGALDPSNINFDGISIRGLRNGTELIYLSCHIDTTRLSHLFQHSKFHLVVDTISFNPYACHLPNLGANGIRMTSARMSERDNSFSFSEREHLTVGVNISLYSSWINEAVMVQQNVPLGTFKMNITIPDGVETYHYSRAEVERNRQYLRDNANAAQGNGLQTEYVEMEGDCFIVPRSYMPISGIERMWGTGEYNIKVRLTENCLFSQDATRNEKLRHWHRDYKQLLKMQKRGSEINEYMKTFWMQYGDNIVKTMVKQGLNTGVQKVGLSKSTGGGW